MTDCRYSFRLGARHSPLYNATPGARSARQTRDVPPSRTGESGRTSPVSRSGSRPADQSRSSNERRASNISPESTTREKFTPPHRRARPSTALALEPAFERSSNASTPFWNVSGRRKKTHRAHFATHLAMRDLPNTLATSRITGRHMIAAE